MCRVAMFDVFTTFKTTPYTFLALGQGGIYGNSIIQSYNTTGVFKLRRGITQGVDIQNPTSTATLHIRPTESFLSTYSDLEGHGVRVNGLTYRIVGVTHGYNYDTNVLEHIRVTLQVEAIAS